MKFDRCLVLINNGVRNSKWEQTQSFYNNKSIHSWTYKLQNPAQRIHEFEDQFNENEIDDVDSHTKAARNKNQY